MTSNFTIEESWFLKEIISDRIKNINRRIELQEYHQQNNTGEYVGKWHKAAIKDKKIMESIQLKINEDI